MPLIASAVDLPQRCEHAVAQDTDGDGRDEIVVGCRDLRSEGPDALTLTLLDFDEGGALQDTDSLDLGTKPMLWDGRWAVDAQGLVSLTPRGRLASHVTPLASLGRSTPAWTPIAFPVDDGEVLILWAAGSYHLVSPTGEALGSFPAPATGHLDSDERAGGVGADLTLRAPPLAIGDVDGDGHDDFLLARGSTAVAWLSPGGALASTKRSLELPLRVEAREDDDERWVTDVVFEDLDGDGKVDLLVSEMAGDGSFFGSTAEVTWYRGTGTGFVQAQRLATGTGSWEVYLRDVDGDGDLDLIIPQVDIGLAALARGLTSKRIPVQLSLYRNDRGVLAAGEVLLQTFVDLDNPTTAWTVDADLDGDGVADLAYIEQDRVVVRRIDGGVLGTLDSRGATDLLTADVDGDGARELFAWGEEGAAVLVRQGP